MIKNAMEITHDFDHNFPTNFLKRITFLHPMGVCGWTFHSTGVSEPRRSTLRVTDTPTHNRMEILVSGIGYYNE